MLCDMPLGLHAHLLSVCVHVSCVHVLAADPQKVLIFVFESPRLKKGLKLMAISERRTLNLICGRLDEHLSAYLFSLF